MYRASREFVEDQVPPEVLLDVVYDVAAYPQFVRGVRRVEVLEDDGQRVLARFTAGVAGLEFQYTLECERDERAVRWRRVAGDFRAAEGRLVHLGGQRFLYENAMDPGFAVPGFAVRFVLERSLPRLIREFRERARERVAQPGAPPGR
ncbi:MAG: hypothetical protein D6731_18875 [Planctomycetota bacterium]|nr:MAG: hypothetical protein D6731_18875 [Planctomycetota bacterium]